MKKVNESTNTGTLKLPVMKTYMYVNGLWIFLFVCLGLISASQGVEDKKVIVDPGAKKNRSPEDVAFYDSLKMEVKEIDVKAKAQHRPSPVKRIIRKYLSE